MTSSSFNFNLQAKEFTPTYVTAANSAPSANDDNNNDDNQQQTAFDAVVSPFEESYFAFSNQQQFAIAAYEQYQQSLLFQHAQPNAYLQQQRQVASHHQSSNTSKNKNTNGNNNNNIETKKKKKKKTPATANSKASWNGFASDMTQDESMIINQEDLDEMISDLRDCINANASSEKKNSNDDNEKEKDPEQKKVSIASVPTTVFSNYCMQKQKWRSNISFYIQCHHRLADLGIIRNVAPNDHVCLFNDNDDKIVKIISDATSVLSKELPLCPLRRLQSEVLRDALPEAIWIEKNPEATLRCAEAWIRTVMVSSRNEIKKSLGGIDDEDDDIKEELHISNISKLASNPATQIACLTRHDFLMKHLLENDEFSPSALFSIRLGCANLETTNFFASWMRRNPVSLKDGGFVPTSTAFGKDKDLSTHLEDLQQREVIEIHSITVSQRHKEIVFRLQPELLEERSEDEDDERFDEDGMCLFDFHAVVGEVAALTRIEANDKIRPLFFSDVYRDYCKKKGFTALWSRIRFVHRALIKLNFIQSNNKEDRLDDHVHLVKQSYIELLKKSKKSDLPEIGSALAKNKPKQQAENKEQQNQKEETQQQQTAEPLDRNDLLLHEYLVENLPSNGGFTNKETILNRFSSEYRIMKKGITKDKITVSYNKLVEKKLIVERESPIGGSRDCALSLQCKTDEKEEKEEVSNSSPNDSNTTKKDEAKSNTEEIARDSEEQTMNDDDISKLVLTNASYSPSSTSTLPVVDLPTAVFKFYRAMIEFLPKDGSFAEKCNVFNSAFTKMYRDKQHKPTKSERDGYLIHLVRKAVILERREATLYQIAANVNVVAIEKGTESAAALQNSMGSAIVENNTQKDNNSEPSLNNNSNDETTTTKNKEPSSSKSAPPAVSTSASPEKHQQESSTPAPPPPLASLRICQGILLPNPQTTKIFPNLDTGIPRLANPTVVLEYLKPIFEKQLHVRRLNGDKISKRSDVKMSLTKLFAGLKEKYDRFKKPSGELRHRLKESIVKLISVGFIINHTPFVAITEHKNREGESIISLLDDDQIIQRTQTFFEIMKKEALIDRETKAPLKKTNRVSVIETLHELEEKVVPTVFPGLGKMSFFDGRARNQVMLNHLEATERIWTKSTQGGKAKFVLLFGESYDDEKIKDCDDDDQSDTKKNTRHNDDDDDDDDDNDNETVDPAEKEFDNLPSKAELFKMILDLQNRLELFEIEDHQHQQQQQKQKQEEQQQVVEENAEKAEEVVKKEESTEEQIVTEKVSEEKQEQEVADEEDEEEEEDEAPVQIQENKVESALDREVSLQFDETEKCIEVEDVHRKLKDLRLKQQQELAALEQELLEAENEQEKLSEQNKTLYYQCLEYSSSSSSDDDDDDDENHDDA